MGLFGRKNKQGPGQDQYNNDDNNWGSPDGFDPGQDQNNADGEPWGFDPWEGMPGQDPGQDPDPDRNEDDNNASSGRRKAFDTRIPVIILAVVVVILLSYVGVSSVIGPRVGQSKEVISELQSGINDLDPTRFVNVLEPKNRLIVQMIFAAIQGSTDVDLSNAFADALNTLCSGVLPSDTGKPVTDILKKVKIVPVNYGLPGKTRNVKCKIQFDGVTYQYIRITLEKYEGETYIKSITPIDK